MARVTTIVRTLEVNIEEENLSFKYDGQSLKIYFHNEWRVIPYEQRNAMSQFLIESTLLPPDTEEDKV